MFTSSELKMLKRYNFSDYFIHQLDREIGYLIRMSLEEDIGKKGDVTSNSIINPESAGFAEIIAKQDGIFAGSFVAKRVFSVLDSSLKVEINAQEGEKIKSGYRVITVSGSQKSILISERTALNFMARMSGIATLTDRFKNIAQNTCTKILDTRKTMPGWRYLDKYSVVIGGGTNHRIGLFDMILIKENHIIAANGIENAVKKCRTYLNKHRLQLKIEVEVTNLNEVTEAMNCNVDRIMLDNMNIDMIKKAVALVNKRMELEISGGIKFDNLNEYLSTEVDYISVGQITHSAHAFDFSLLMNRK